MGVALTKSMGWQRVCVHYLRDYEPVVTQMQAVAAENGVNILAVAGVDIPFRGYTWAAPDELDPVRTVRWGWTGNLTENQC